MRRITLSTLVVAAALIALTVQLGPVRPSIVRAHPAAHPPTPPTYDWDTATAGTQPPTSPLLAGATVRWLDTFRLQGGAIVPLAELQAILPLGFTATEFPAAGSGQALIGFLFAFQSRFERLGVGTFGPASGVLIFHQGLNTNTEPDRREIIFLAAEFSDASWVDAFNAAFGSGSSRVAEVEVEIDEKAGQLQLKFEVEDESIGLNVTMEAVGPAAITARSHADPLGFPIRFLNDGIFPNPAHRVANQEDNRIIPSAEANLTFDAELRLPGGSLTVVGVGPNVNFRRWVETFGAPE